MTKEHAIPYLLHSYCSIKLKNEKFKNIDFTQIDWNKEPFIINFINWYYENNNSSSESECYTYIKAKLENKIIINEELLKNEVKKGKQYIIVKLEQKILY